MNEQFVTYEIALKLKELAFNEPCLAYYTKENIYEKDTNFVLLSKKIRGELSGQGTVENKLFKYLKDNNETSGELFILSNSIAAPLWQQAIDWLHKKLEFNYPYLKIEIYSDKSGSWHQSKDNSNTQLDILFDNIGEAVLKAIEIIKNDN